MAVTVVLNGVSYEIPDPGGDGWGQDLTDYFVAQASGLLQKAGGTFSLTAEVDFGATYGLKSAYFKSRNANPASTGQVRLGNTESVKWRNAANDADLALLVNASNLLEFNGTALQPAGNYITALTGDVTASGPGSVAATIAAGAVTNAKVSNTAAIAYSKLNLAGSVVNADISAAAAIAYSKLALTGSIVNADISAAAAIAYSKLSLTGSVVNADISGAAAIAYGKLALTGSVVYADLAVALQNLIDGKVDKSTLTTKGDLFVATAASTIARQGVGNFGQVLTADSAQTNGLKWADPVQGTKNYLSTNNNFEGGVTTGWSIGHVSIDSTTKQPTGSPTFGSGASGTLSISASSSSPLAGTYSLLFADSAASTQGDLLASDAMPLDAEAQGQVLAFRFPYNASSGGSNMNMSGTSSNSYGVSFYDVTNSAWLSPAGVFNLVQKTGVGFCTGTVQIPITCTSIRIVVFNANATAGAATLKLDDFFFGPQVMVAGAAISDDVAVTPTGTWISNSTYTGFLKRVGDRAKIKMKVALSGAPTSATLTFNLPSGVVIDTTKLLTANGNNYLLGKSQVYDSSSGLTYQGRIRYSSTTVIQPVDFSVSGAQVDTASITQAAPVTFATGDYVEIEAEFPVVGWSSNTVMSQDTDTRRVNAMFGISTANLAVNGLINFPTIYEDTHGSYNAGTYTVPVTGQYKIEASEFAFTSNEYLYVYKNGVYLQTLLYFLSTGPSVEFGNSSNYFNAGDQISIRTSASNTINYSAGNYRAKVTITRISGPATIAATETVACKYQNTAGTGLTGSNATIPFATKVYDTHAAFAAGIFTAPVSGKYRITSSLTTQSVTNSTSQLVALAFKVTSTPEGLSGSDIDIEYKWGAGVARAETLNGSRSFWLNAGDTLEVRAASSNAVNLNTSAGRNIVCIERVGN
jgi:hypothetical protein